MQDEVARFKCSLDVGIKREGHIRDKAKIIWLTGRENGSDNFCDSERRKIGESD